MLMLPLSLAACSEKTEFSFSGLNTVITVSCEGDFDKDELERELQNTVREYELVFSRTDAESELYRINNSDETQFFISEHLAAVIERAFCISEITDGAFDFTCGALVELWNITDKESPIPTDEEIKSALLLCGYEKLTYENGLLTRPVGVKIDLGGIAKGYIAEKVTERAIALGAEFGIISLGGNISAFGEKKDGTCFKIGIRSPYSQGIAGTVELERGYISVSGTYERNKTVDGIFYHHIFDMESGMPVNNGIVGIAIAGEDAILADALSTALFVTKSDIKALMNEKFPNMSAVIYRDDGSFETVGNINYKSRE